jgi:tRNA(fMet)-specific endonuclease VapC
MTELRLGIENQYDADSEAYDEATSKLDRLCSRFEVLELTRPVSVATADIIATLKESGEPLHDLHDVYIAATARTEQLPVLTANVDHFERIDDVSVVDWATY